MWHKLCTLHLTAIFRLPPIVAETVEKLFIMLMALPPFSICLIHSLSGNSERKLWKAVEVVARAMLAVMTTQAIKNLFIMGVEKSLSGSQPASQLVNSRTVTTKLINFTITEQNCECAN